MKVWTKLHGYKAGSLTSGETIRLVLLNAKIIEVCRTNKLSFALISSRSSQIMTNFKMAFFQ